MINSIDLLTLILIGFGCACVWYLGWPTRRRRRYEPLDVKMQRPTADFLLRFHGVDRTSFILCWCRLIDHGRREQVKKKG